MNNHIIEDRYKLNPEKWVPQAKNKIESKQKKYVLLFSFFIFGLVLISTIKNETRKLQKEIYNLQSSLNKIKITLHEANLDYQYLTSPENIDKLAKENLDGNFTFYKKSQINSLNEEQQVKSKIEQKNKKSINIKIAKKIKEKKIELRKLKELYSNPSDLPATLKKQIENKIKTKKTEIEELSSDPNEFWKNKKVQRWAGVQIIKAALGIPIIPGR